MSFRFIPLPACALAMLLLGSAPSSTSAQTADELFDARTLHDVRLRVNERDMQLLRERYHLDTVYPADLEWRGVRVRNVGIRSRGSASRNQAKLGLRVDFNRYVTGQQFLGLDALVLDNLRQDPAMMRERTAMALFARLGQAAARESFCRLYINDEYQGVYALVEPIDKAFLRRTVGDDSGYLFEYRWVQAFRGEDLGDDLEAYAPLFEADTHENQPASVLYEPIRELFREVNAEDDTLWQERVEAYLDLRQFVTKVAIEMFIADIDGFLGNWGINNFSMYRADGTTRHRVFPWDMDVAFDRIDHPVLLHAEENVIFRRAFERADLRALFLDVLEQCARSAMQDDWLANEIEITAALITAAAHEDSRKAYSNEEFDAGIAFLRDFARRRPAFVLREVAALRGQ